MRKRTVILLTLFLVLLLACSCAWLGISVWYGEHFLPGTSINGVEVSGKTAAQAEDLVAEEAEKYRLILRTAQGTEESIEGEDIGYRFVRGEETGRLLASQPKLLWPAAAFGQSRSLNIPEQMEFQEDLLREQMLALDCMQSENIIKTEDAHIDLINGVYTVVKEVQGTELDAGKLEQVLKSAVEAGTTKVFLEETDCYVKPAVLEDDGALQARAAVLNKYSSITVTYLMGGGVTETLDASTTAGWFTLDENERPVFDEEKVRAWVNDLADRYDTIGTWPAFITSNGEEVYPEAKTYGWQMDREAETAALLQLLSEGASAQREPVWLESAATRGKNDIGDTYVEIDYTNQRMWFYKNGSLLVETPVVTGNTSLGQDSPEGIFCIVGKEENAVLKGEGYETPVSWWMPFYGGVGIHDADTWRTEYGGQIYQYSGSHGCINTPAAQAAVIYANIEVGTPVVCYKSTVDYGYPTVQVTGSVMPQTGQAQIPSAGSAAGQGQAELSWPQTSQAGESYWDDALANAPTDSTVLVVP